MSLFWRENPSLLAEREHAALQVDGRPCSELVEALELRSLMRVGEIILTSALHRRESRGSHFREDCPDRDDEKFLQHTIASYSPEAGVTIDYMPVVVNQFEPKERKY